MISEARFKRSRYMILFPSLLSIIVIWNRYYIPSITSDGVIYIQIARNILFKGELGWQALWCTPFFSILLAVFSYLTRVNDLLVVTSFISPLMFFLLVLTVYLLAQQIFDCRTALIASTVTAISPHLLFIAFSPEPEIAFTCFLFISLAVFTLAVKQESLIYSILTGFFFALAYMSRSEGFLVMVLVFMATTAVQGKNFYRSRIFKLCIAATIIFFMVTSPYLYFLKKHYGTIVISPKASYVMIWMKSRIYHENDKGEVGNIDLWGLNSEGKLFWQEPKGIGYLVEFLMSHPKKNILVYLHNLYEELPGRVPNNSGMENYPQLFPVYFALAALASIFMKWGTHAKEKMSIVLAPLIIFLILPIFTGGWWKYLVPYFPIVVILAAKGVTGGASVLAARINHGIERKVETVVTLLIVGAIGAHFYFALHPISKTSSDIAQITRTTNADEDRIVGEWAFKRFGPGKNYMFRWSKTIYSLNGFWTPLPVASDLETIAYAKKNNVDYILSEMQNWEEPARYPYLELVDVYRSKNFFYSVAFYRLTQTP